jgi:hypothetical protein
MKTIPLIMMGLLSAVTALSRTVDDFDDGFRSGWTEHVTGAGGAVTEAFGVLNLDLPIGRTRQSSYVAASWSAEPMGVEEGQTLELRVDLVSAPGENTFGVLAWVPDSEPVSRFAGYFIARSGREIRVGKTLHRYFLIEEPDPPIKHPNVTLVLSLTAQDGNVTVRAQVLDPAAGNAVLFDRSFIDTPDADPVQSGTDDPAGPWAGSGQLVLMAYSEDGNVSQDFVRVMFDNAWASPPAPANLRPVFHDVQPANTASFLPLNAAFILKATDDSPFWQDNPGGVVTFVDGPFLALAVGVVNGSGGRTLEASMAANPAIDREYTVGLLAVDADGATNTASLRFDTFSPLHPVIELEDYNFDGGRYIDGPILIPEGSEIATNAYLGQVGIAGVDFEEAGGGTGGSTYRPGDPVGIKRSLDYLRAPYRDAGGPENQVWDYDVHEIVAGETLSYTRTFPDDVYEVYLRQSLINVESAETALEHVTRDDEGEETVIELGRFRGENGGFEYRNVPLRDSRGLRVAVRLVGVETLRLRQLASTPSDGVIAQNYLVFVPAPTLSFQVTSSTTPGGIYAPDGNAQVNGNVVTVALSAPGARYYRVRSDFATGIGSVRLEDGTLVFEVRRL